MSVISLSAKLDRSDSSTPWGFRLAGGKDFNAPLTVQKVVQGSLAERCGIQSGDVITSISGRDTQHFRHSDAQSAIQQAHNSLDLKLQRGGGGGVAPSYAPMIQTSGLQDTTTTFKAGPVQHYKPGERIIEVQCGNASPRPFGTSGASTVTSNVSTYKTTTRTTMDSVTGQTQDMNLGETTSQPAYPPWRSQAPRSAPFRPSAPAGGQSQTTHTVQVQRWQPQVPSGPRTPRFVRRGEVRTSTGMHAGRIPICNLCSMEIRGPFVLALDTTWCPDHFVCSNPTCRTSLVETGFVEEGGNLYCEKDYAQYFAPACAKCRGKIIGDCVNALHKTFHPHCFVCVHCRQPIGRGSFHMEDGNPYCEKDWQALYQTKCYGCQFPIEPGDRWVEALSQNWHSECFNCSTCQVNLEGQPFFAKGGRPYCKRHSGNY